MPTSFDKVKQDLIPEQKPIQSVISPIAKLQKKEPVIVDWDNYVPSNEFGFTKSEKIFGEGEKYPPKTYSFANDQRFNFSDTVNPKRFEIIPESEKCSKIKRVQGNIAFGKQKAHNLDDFFLKPVYNDNLDTRKLEKFKYTQ